MAKDIFSEDYFEKHRDSSFWKSSKKISLNKALNLKNKPKPKLDEVIPKKENREQEILRNIKIEETRDEQVFKEKPKKRKIKSENSEWKFEFFKLLVAGFCGGLIVAFSSKFYYFAKLNQFSFWTNIGIVALIAFVFILVFGLIFKLIYEHFNLRN